MHGEAVEADLARFYGMPLAALFTGDVSPRRLLTLIRKLPGDSATVRSMSGRDGAWSRSDVLLSDVFHALTGQPHPDRKRAADSSGADGERAAIEALQARATREREATRG